jgi:hypothetical protein
MKDIEIKAELNMIADRLKTIANAVTLASGEPSVSDMTLALNKKLGRKELCYQMKVDGSSVSAWIYGGGIKSSNLKKLKALYKKTFSE